MAGESGNHLEKLIKLHYDHVYSPHFSPCISYVLDRGICLSIKKVYFCLSFPSILDPSANASDFALVSPPSCAKEKNSGVENGFIPSHDQCILPCGDIAKRNKRAVFVEAYWVDGSQRRLKKRISKQKRNNVDHKLHRGPDYSDNFLKMQ